MQKNSHLAYIFDKEGTMGRGPSRDFAMLYEVDPVGLDGAIVGSGSVAKYQLAKVGNGNFMVVRCDDHNRGPLADCMRR